MIGTYEQQVLNETQRKEDTLNKYINTFHTTLEKGGIEETSEGKLFIKLGFDKVVSKIQEYIDAKATGDTRKDRDLLLNMCDDPKILAYTALSVLLTYVVKQNNAAKVTTVSARITDAIMLEQGKRRLKESDPKMFKYMDSVYRRASKKRKLDLMKIHIKNMEERIGVATNMEYASDSISRAQEIRIGGRLLDCVIASGVNLFRKGTLHNRGKSGFTYVIGMTPQGKDVLNVAFSTALNRLTSSYPPMVIPPDDWTNNYDGGLLTHKTPIMKMKTQAGHEKLKEVEIPKVYPVLNKLQKTAWRINPFIVDTITDIFEGNMVDPRSPKKLPRLFGGLSTNTPYDPADIIRKESYGAVDSDTGMFENIEDFKRWKRDIEAVTIALDGEMGRRLHLISALGEAQGFIDYDNIYFSYTLDSRGRVYTQQSIITPQGSAEVKAMLEFADGQILDERGEYWFKIHTANVYGMDKENFDDRISWFDDNVSIIRNNGSSPLNFISGWAYCDSPFEFLAACKAWVDHEAGLPVHVPIQLDATNSGVQIYSGLLGDLEGAETVNVVNTGQREDVYGIVANKVNQALLSKNYPKIFNVTLADGGEKSQSTRVEAESIAGNITRSIVKRNVMTVPYSVSKRGMSDQLWDIIDDARLSEKEWWSGDPWVVNKLLTDLNYEAIYDTIPGARMGQDYLVGLAALCNEKEGMYYTTPLYDIPVVQRKPKVQTHTVRTVLGVLNFYVDLPNSIDRMAQKNGSAPNYVHSIDSTLLLRVIETMSNQIGVIHDCFIGHANDGDELQLRFKEAYIEIMKLKPLELIGAQLDPEGVLDVPYIGTLDLDRVMDAEYIIS